MRRILQPFALAPGLGLIAALPVLLAALGASCAATNDPSDSSGPAGGSGGATGGTESVGGFGLSGGSSAGGEGGSIDECVSKNVVGEVVPLDMVILQDRSGSMTSSNKWTQAVDGIKAFVDNPALAGLHVGLTYFPPILGNECTVASYSNLEVPIDVLPPNAFAIKTSLLDTTPSGGTPMRPALEGAIQAMTAYLAQNPTHAGIVILVTDGDPGGCSPNTVSDVAAAAAAGVAQIPSVRTFVVGMSGATFANLDTIAAAGGTAPSFDVTAGSSAFVAALEQIQQSALSCTYTLPVPPPQEGELDPDSVAVEYIPGLNEPPQSIDKVDSEADCGEISGGFYYDDPVEPTQIVLCPASCELVQSGTVNAYVNIVLGCIEPPPR
jgi:hypothetical protein